MRKSILFGTILLAAGTALADFQYSSTTKSAGGLMSGGDSSGETTRNLLKGDKIKIDDGSTATILDFGAQTVTEIDHEEKTYSVSSFEQLRLAGTRRHGSQPGPPEIEMDLRETGEKKTIRGFFARRVIITMEMGNAELRREDPSAKLKITMDVWLSSDVPGAREMSFFYRRLAEASASGVLPDPDGDPDLQRAMANVYRRLASLGGVPVVETFKTSLAGDQASKAADALTRMGNRGSEPGVVAELTTENSGFSTKAIAASEFAVPAGYRREKSH